MRLRTRYAQIVPLLASSSPYARLPNVFTGYAQEWRPHKRGSRFFSYSARARGGSVVSASFAAQALTIRSSGPLRRVRGNLTPRVAAATYLKR